MHLLYAQRASGENMVVYLDVTAYAGVPTLSCALPTNLLAKRPSASICNLRRAPNDT